MCGIYSALFFAIFICFLLIRHAYLKVSLQMQIRPISFDKIPGTPLF